MAFSLFFAVAELPEVIATAKEQTSVFLVFGVKCVTFEVHSVPLLLPGTVEEYDFCDVLSQDSSYIRTGWLI